MNDALAALSALDGQAVPLSAGDAVDLLALVAGQDAEQGGDGVFRIARKTAKDRVISTVEPPPGMGTSHATGGSTGIRHTCRWTRTPS